MNELKLRLLNSQKIKTICLYGVYSAIVVGILVYLTSIFWVNLNGRQWASFDIYSDAIIAKYMAEAHSLFPENWIFGNQFYVVATPVLASLFYHVTQDSYLSLAIASCVMTALIVIAFVWCLKPFVKKSNILIGLFCMIGAVNVGIFASGDINGLQLFFTMASYYACYIVGIFYTLGIWLRLYFQSTEDFKNKWIHIIIALLFNFALGMQSLRQMLVLNLPLCVISLGSLFFDKSSFKFSSLIKNHHMFALGGVLTGLFGMGFMKLLIHILNIRQNQIITSPTGGLIDTLKHIYNDIRQYIGVTTPNWSWTFSVFKFVVGIITIAIVTFVVIHIIVAFFKKKEPNAITLLILFCIVSLLAVMAAGMLVIYTRTTYYFVWYILVAFSFVYLHMLVKRRFILNITLIACLVLIGIQNYSYGFVSDFQRYEPTKNDLEAIISRLDDDGIEMLYVGGAPHITGISSLTNDRILSAALGDTTTSLRCSHLTADDWFENGTPDNSYFVFSNDFRAVPEEEKDELARQLTFVFEMNGYYFYRGTPTLYNAIHQAANIMH